MTDANGQPAMDAATSPTTAPPVGASSTNTTTAGTASVPATTPPALPPPLIPQGDLDFSQRYTKAMRCNECLDRKWYDCDFVTRPVDGNGVQPPCSNCRFYGGPNCTCTKGPSLHNSLYAEIVDRGRSDGSLIPPKLRQLNPMSQERVPVGWQGRRNPEGQPQLPPNLQGPNIRQRLGLTNKAKSIPPQVVVHNFFWGYPPPWAIHQPPPHPPHQLPQQRQPPQSCVERRGIPPTSAHPMRPQATPPPPSSHSPKPARVEHALPPKPAKSVPPGGRPAGQRPSTTPLASAPTPFHPGLKRRREADSSEPPATSLGQQHLPPQGTDGFSIKGAAQLSKRRKRDDYEEL